MLRRRKLDKIHCFQTKVLFTKWRWLGGRGGCQMSPASMGDLPMASKYPRKLKGKENMFSCKISQIVLYKGIYFSSWSGYLNTSLCPDLSTCRCGQCSTCTMADCGTCRICGINQEQISKGETTNFDKSPHHLAHTYHFLSCFPF